MNPTREQIESASTKGLQDFYLQMVGKSTTNRNAKALRSRLLGMLNEVKGVVPCEPLHQEAIDEANAKSSKPARVKKIAERVGKRAVAAVERLDKAAAKKPATRKAKVAPAKPVKSKTKITQNFATAGERKKSTERRSHAESFTRKTLAGLKEGQELTHAFRGGLVVKATVITPPNMNGNGGKYRHDKKVYDDLRKIQREASDTPYNVLLFWGLAPWPKHRKREAS